MSNPDTMNKGEQTTFELTDENFFSVNVFGEGNIIHHLESLNPSKVEIQRYDNRHVDNQVDTTFLFYFDNTSVGIYKHHSEQIVSGANINNKQIWLKNGIKIGMPKNHFFKEFNIDLSNYKIDTIKVNDEVYVQQIEFIFQYDSLRKINYEGYID